MTSTRLSTTREATRKRKEEFAELVGQGLSPKQAGNRVGMTAENKIRAYMKDELVLRILKKIHNENIIAMQMTRDKVQEIVLEAVDMGRTMSDPLAMIRGAQEINKMCGYYAPEEKKITLTSEQRRTITQFDDMSDEEIARVLDSSEIAEALEAEFEEIDVSAEE